MSLNIEQLESLVTGETVAIRGTATLEPAGGAGDKIFPPTHALDTNNKRPEPGAKYAFETRRIVAAAAWIRFAIAGMLVERRGSRPRSVASHHTVTTLTKSSSPAKSEGFLV